MQMLQMFALLTFTLVTASASQSKVSLKNAVLSQNTRYSRDEKVRPPVIDVGPSSTIFKHHATVFLKCEASGTPPITNYTWFRNGESRPLTHSNYRRVNRTFGTVKITNTNRHFHNGCYQCQATNGYGVATSDSACIFGAHVDLWDPREDMPEIATRHPREGQDLQLSCKYRSVFPRCKFYWTLNGTGGEIKINLTDRITVNERGNLNFANVIPEDVQGGKIYVCHIVNELLSIDVATKINHQIELVLPRLVGSTCFLDSNVRSKCGYPKISETECLSRNCCYDKYYPDDVQCYYSYMSIPNLLRRSSSKNITIAIACKPISLYCVFYGFPTPYVEWARAGGNSFPYHGPIIKVGTELKLLNVSTKDAATYICIASNRAGRTTHTIKLIVEAAPQFFPPGKPQLRNIEVKEGNSATMTCKAIGIPPPSIRWFANGREINAIQYSFLFSESNTKLTFTQVGKRDTRVVSCNASNPQGYVYSIGYINVV